MLARVALKRSSSPRVLASSSRVLRCASSIAASVSRRPEPTVVDAASSSSAATSRVAASVRLARSSAAIAVALGDFGFEGFDPHGAAAEFLHALMLDGERLLGLPLDAPLKDGELGPKMVLFRRQFRDREGKHGFRAPARQAIRPGVDGWNDEKRDEGRRKEAQREEHDGFDHAGENSRVRSVAPEHPAMRLRGFPERFLARPAVRAG